MNLTTDFLNASLWYHQKNATAFHALVTEYRWVVKQIGRGLGDSEKDADMRQEGELALCEAVDPYYQKRPDVRFSTYAYPYVRRAMVSFLRTDAPVKGTEYLARAAQQDRREGKRWVRGLLFVDLEVPGNEEALTVTPQDAGLDRQTYPSLLQAALTEFTEGGSLSLFAVDHHITRQEAVERLTQEASDVGLLPAPRPRRKRRSRAK